MRVPNQSAGVDRSAGAGAHEGRTLGEAQGVAAQRMKLATVRCVCDPTTDICVCDNGRVLRLLLGNL